MDESNNNTIEEWRPVVGYESAYEVSDQGRVKRVLPARGATAGHVLFPAINSTGYFYVVLSTNNQPKTRLVHQLVAESFIGIRPQGKGVNHIDGIKTNNCKDNLEYLTQSDNVRHAVSLGLTARGTRCNSKLTEADVMNIRHLWSIGTLTGKQIAKQFNVEVSTIRDIYKRRTWTHI